MINRFIFWGLLAISIALVSATLLKIGQIDEKRRLCEKLGGVPITDICVVKPAIIPI